MRFLSFCKQTYHMDVKMWNCRKWRCALVRRTFATLPTNLSRISSCPEYCASQSFCSNAYNYFIELTCGTIHILDKQKSFLQGIFKPLSLSVQYISANLSFLPQSISRRSLEHCLFLTAHKTTLLI